MRHLAFLSAAFALATSMAVAQPQVTVTKRADQSSTPAEADHFAGRARVEGRFQAAAPARVGGASVIFEPGAHTDWHSHPLGQTLIVTTGTGFVRQWGGPRQSISTGDTVWIPPGVKHWHGAAPGTGMTHLAIAESLAGRTVTWMEKVTDAQYRQ